MRVFFLILFILVAFKAFSQESCSARLPPFEKIYVTQEQLAAFHDGIYFYDQTGQRTKVKTLQTDCQGKYILIVYYQCPLCGRCWPNGKPHEGYCCPIFPD